MNNDKPDCRQIRKIIYLYREISPTQRKIVDDHLLNCEECSIIFQRIEMGVKAFRKSLSRVGYGHPPHNLTERVITAVNRPQGRQLTFSKGLHDFLNARPVRLTLATFSLLFLILFAYEFRTPSRLLSQAHVTEPLTAAKVSTLDSKKFYRTTRVDKNANQDLYLSYVACIQRCLAAGIDDCEACSIRINKLTR